MNSPTDIYKTPAMISVSNDPLLKNLFKSRTNSNPAETQDTFKPQPIGPLDTVGTDPTNIYSEINWIKIPTFEDESDSSTNTYISMLSVKTYTATECVNIKTGLGNKEIDLSTFGDVTVYPPMGSDSYNEGVPMLFRNTIIPTTRPTPVAVSVDNLESRRRNKERRFFENTSSYLFSRDLRWIIYKIPNKHWSSTETSATITNGAPSVQQIPVFVLLYNTIHRRNFQGVYVKMMQYSFNTNQGRNTSCADSPVAACRDAAYNDTPLSTGVYDSVHKTILKYCNAFVSGTATSGTGLPLKKYGDPSCGVVIDPVLSSMNFIHRHNYTKHSLERNFYHPVAEIAGPRSGYLNAYRLSQNEANWAAFNSHCATNTSDVVQENDAIAFLRETTGLVQSGCLAEGTQYIESDSFIQQHVNHVMRFTNLYTTTFPTTPHISNKGISTCDIIPPENLQFNSYGCLFPSTQVIIDCSINVQGSTLTTIDNEYNQICGLFGGGGSGNLINEPANIVENIVNQPSYSNDYVETVQSEEEVEAERVRQENAAAALAAFEAEEADKNDDSFFESELFKNIIIAVVVLIMMGVLVYFLLIRKKSKRLL